MKLPTVQAIEHASTNPSASKSAFTTFMGDALNRLASRPGRELHRPFRERIYAVASRTFDQNL